MQRYKIEEGCLAKVDPSDPGGMTVEEAQAKLEEINRANRPNPESIAPAQIVQSLAPTPAHPVTLPLGVTDVFRVETWGPEVVGRAAEKWPDLCAHAVMFLDTMHEIIHGKAATK